MTGFGAVIPHVPGKPFPYDANEIMIKFRGENSFIHVHSKVLHWGEIPSLPSAEIIAYRLPADHHAYGPRISRMGREPDGWVNDYGDDYGVFREERSWADFLAASAPRSSRVGIWRIYQKDV